MVLRYSVEGRFDFIFRRENIIRYLSTQCSWICFDSITTTDKQQGHGHETRYESKRSMNQCSQMIIPIDDNCNYCCGACESHWCFCTYCWYSPDNKVHGANMEPTWVLSAPDGPHVGPMNLAIRELVIDLCLMTPPHTHTHIYLYIYIYIYMNDGSVIQDDNYYMLYQPCTSWYPSMI